MSSFSKYVLMGVTALSALVSVAAEARSDAAPQRAQVLAAQRQVVSATPVVHRRHHHHRRHAHRPVRRPHP